jgi:hypothetical protein
VGVLVAGVEGVVGVVGVEVEGVVTVEVVVVEVEVEVVCVTVGVVVVLEVWVAVLTVPHCLLARVRTVSAPWPMSDTRVGSTEPGRLATWVCSAPIAFKAPAQSLLARAVEAALSSLVSELDSLAESRLELAPQDARNAAASPSPPARRARGT